MWAALSPYQRAVSKAFGFTQRCFGYNPGAASAVHQEQRRAMLVAGQETYAEHMQRTAREFAEQHGLPAPIVTTRTE
jgi:hypothetical protein